MGVDVRTTVVGLALAAALGACGGGTGTTEGAPSTSRPSTSSTTNSAAPSSSQPAVTSPTKTRASLGDECGPDSELSQEEWVAKCADTTNNEFPVEGSVTTEGRSITFPDGIKVSLVKVTRRLNTGEIANDEAVGKTIVEVTARYTNTGTEPWAMPDTGGLDGILLYGVNRYEAQRWAGESHLPQRLMPGTSAKQTDQFTLDAKDLKVLAFTVQPDSEVDPEYTFTDVETLIKR